MTAGEAILAKIEPVEDTKANSGECGCLIMTNLRIMWYSSKTAKLNLSKLIIKLKTSLANFLINSSLFHMKSYRLQLHDYDFFTAKN